MDNNNGAQFITQIIVEVRMIVYWKGVTVDRWEVKIQDLSLKCSAWKSFVLVFIPESLVPSALVLSPQFLDF